MAEFNSNRRHFLVAWQMMVAQRIFQGFSDDEIIEEIFHMTRADGNRYKNKKRQIEKLKQMDIFITYYEGLQKDWAMRNTGRALSRISTQIDDPNPWMANKAANDVLTQSRHLFGENDNTITLKVEGIPELGTPDQEES